MSGSGTGIDLANPAAGQISENDVAAVDTALLLGAEFTGSIDDNDFTGAAVGVYYQTGEPLSANRIHNNEIGVLSNVADPSMALGFVAGVQPNQIYLNTMGVELVNATMQAQHVYDNQTGVGGSGTLVPTDLADANVIEENVVGVNFTGPIEFNRIAWNSIGIEAQSNQLIAHNEIYDNTETAVEVQGQATVSIVNNTLFQPDGRPDPDRGRGRATSRCSTTSSGRSRASTCTSPITASRASTATTTTFSAAGRASSFPGTAWPSTTSSTGRTTLTRSTWTRSAARSSIPSGPSRGSSATSVGDFDVFNELAGLRFTSPTIDAGDPISDEALPSYYDNLLANPGFESGLTGWTATPGSTTQSGTPAAWQGSSYFAAGGNAVATVEQTIDLTASGFTAQQIDTENLNVIFGGRVRSGTANPSAAGTIEVTFYDASGDVLEQYSAVATNTTDRWELVGASQSIPAHARTAVFEFIADGNGGTDDSYLDGAFFYVQSDNLRPDQGAEGNTDAGQSTNAAPHLAIKYAQPVRQLGPERAAANPLELVRQHQHRAGPHRPLPGRAERAAVPHRRSRPAPPTPANTPGPRPTAASISAPTACGSRSRWSATPPCSTGAPRPSRCPENTTTFYVNDGSTVGDQYTTAPGSNRNDGRLPSAPLPYINNVLRTYSLGPGDTLYVDTGNYRSCCADRAVVDRGRR